MNECKRVIYANERGTRVVWTVFKLTVNFLVRPQHHGGQIAACFRGIWHGLTGNVAARY